MRVALMQMQAMPGNLAGNIAQIEAAMRAEARLGTRLVIAPELALSGYGAGDAIRDLAEPVDGPSLQRLAELSRRTGVALILGFAERAEGILYNSAAFLDGAAPPVIHRKTHLYGDYERALFAPGTPRPGTVQCDGLRIGMLICYDVEFPENVRPLAQAGADLVAVPTALPCLPGSEFIARSMIPVRAFENQVFVAYADHAGADSRFSYAGLSSIAAPDGGVLARAGTGPARIAARVDPAAFAASRAANTYLRDL
ncbi:MAG: hydrolase [Alphaproteobacteria bacterium]|nr:MAG: hydrolase [Alphaproteobacteria bacterium]